MTPTSLAHLGRLQKQLLVANILILPLLLRALLRLRNGRVKSNEYEESNYVNTYINPRFDDLRFAAQFLLVLHRGPFFLSWSAIESEDDETKYAAITPALGAGETALAWQFAVPASRAVWQADPGIAAVTAGLGTAHSAQQCMNVARNGQKTI